MITDLIDLACFVVAFLIARAIADELLWRWRLWRIRRQVWKRLMREVKQ